MRILIIDVADGATEAKVIVNALKPDKTITVGGLCNGVAQVMADITRIAPLGGITELIIKSHGSAGAQGMGIGQGTGIPKPFDIGSVLTLRYLADPQNRNTVSLITPYFGAKATVKLYGCHTGDDDEGIAFVKALADIWKVPVTASTWFNFKNSATLFGSTVEALPGGTVNVQQWSDPARMREMLADPAVLMIVPLEALRKVTGH